MRKDRISRLTPAQQRALESVEMGLVVRKYRSQLGGMLECPGVRPKALWDLLRDGFICDGVGDDNHCIMALTPTGQRELTLFTPMASQENSS
ncbi:hypothetical protein [Bradyrhizobium macuxiense]|uniref:hypothetical protein n=1 Tax=Bradyrhizobium macuxiense TaxID=1755647 RepID=UPI0010A968D1|nr:hypothetical protein [Bradyrhizobium macuxiense]